MKESRVGKQSKRGVDPAKKLPATEPTRDRRDRRGMDPSAEPRKTRPPKKASGANIENWQRHTMQVLLRLSPLAARALREGAAREETTMSGYVERLVIAAIPEAD